MLTPFDKMCLKSWKEVTWGRETGTSLKEHLNLLGWIADEYCSIIAVGSTEWRSEAFPECTITTTCLPCSSYTIRTWVIPCCQASTQQKTHLSLRTSEIPLSPSVQMLVLVILENWASNPTFYTTSVNFCKKIVASQLRKCKTRLDWKTWQGTAGFTFFVYHKGENTWFLQSR